MALVVENGTGTLASESYISVADAVTYAAARGLTFPGASAPEIALAEQSLRRATAWIDNIFRSRFLGWRRLGREQYLEWPRAEAYVSGPPDYTIGITEIPREVKYATVEAAVRELAVPSSLSPDVTPGKILSSVSVEGAVSVTYAISSGVQDQRPVLTVVGGILAPVLNDGSGGLFGVSSRG